MWTSQIADLNGRGVPLQQFCDLLVNLSNNSYYSGSTASYAIVQETHPWLANTATLAQPMAWAGKGLGNLFEKQQFCWHIIGAQT